MPRLSDADMFLAVLGIAQDGLQKGAISLRFRPQGSTNFTVDEKSLDPLLEKGGIDRKDFHGIFNGEIAVMVEAILCNQVEAYVHRMQPDSDEEESPEETRRIFVERAETVKEKIVDDDIKSRYRIKVTSKRPGLKNLEWEVNKKLIVGSSGEEIARPYVSVSIETIRVDPYLDEFFRMAPFFQNFGRTEYTDFDLDEYDIQSLIDRFQKMKVALERSKAEGA